MFEFSFIPFFLFLMLLKLVFSCCKTIMDAVRSEIDDEALLHSISNFKSLYNKKDEGYKSKLQKENCWISICNTLAGCTVMEAKARFESLREKNRREVLIKKKLERSGAPANSRPVWPFMSFFHFLYECGEEANRETISNIPVEHFEISDAEDEHIYVQFAEDAGSSTPSCSSTFRSPIPKRRKDHSDASMTDSSEVSGIDSLLMDLSSIIKSITEKKANCTDTYELFFKYLASELTLVNHMQNFNRRHSDAGNKFHEKFKG